MELGEEKKLKFAMACADFIQQLKVFSESCKPVWLFLVDGMIGRMLFSFSDSD